MNGIIALCHFCELHGPSVLFCTQAFHSKEDPLEHFHTDSALDDPASNSTAATHPSDQLLLLSHPSPSSSSPSPIPESPSEPLSHHNSNQSLNSSPAPAPPQAAHPPSSPAAASTASVSSSPASPASPAASFAKRSHHAVSAGSTCPSCRSVSDEIPGYITNDPVAKVSYVSSQFPDHPSLYSHIRQACVRSLSCEVCPGREGAVLFGDDKSGYVFSYTFFVRDAQARGFQRWYSIISLMTDRVYLVNSWFFLVSAFKDIITDLQRKTNVKFDVEQSRRTQDARFGGGRAMGPAYAMSPDQFRRRRGNQALRSLQDLSGDESLFAQLHASFAWTLKACGEHIFERQIEGPPLIASGHPDDTDKLVPELSKRDSFLCFSTLSELINVIGIDFFNIILFNVVIGNQLIVRGDEAGMVVSLLRLVQDLIPVGCCSAVYFSDSYKDSWQCNFLGMRGHTEMSSHVDSTSYVLLDITCESKDELASLIAEFQGGSLETRVASSSDPSNRLKITNSGEDTSTLSDGHSASHLASVSLSQVPAESAGSHHLSMPVPYLTVTPSPSTEAASSLAHLAPVGSAATALSDRGGGAQPRRDSSDSSASRFSSFSFAVQASNQAEADRGNSFTRRTMAILTGTMYTDAVKKEFVVTLKEEWMHKAKLFFKFSKENSRQDGYEEKLLRLLKALDLQKDDLPVLRFWTTGLSKKYRTKLLLSSK